MRIEADDTVIDSREACLFRSVAARANYLSLDRSDIQYSVKEICRGMAAPTRLHVKRLRRLARYLIDHPRVIWRFDWQGRENTINGYSDSDWAGCRRSAKSTSGGAIMVGKHTLKTWSNTQKSITLSSGEAELVAVVKLSCELIGMTQLLDDWGINVTGQVHVDSTAALGVVKRKGNGKMRHVRVGMLWVQQLEEAGDIRYVKINGTTNPADLMTKAVTAAMAEKHLSTLNQHFETGIAEVGLHAV